MKTSISIILLFATCLFGCQKTNQTDSDNLTLVKKYYEGLQISDFKLINKSIADTFIVQEGESVTQYTKNDYMDWFQWDSLFHPVYKLVNLQIINDSIIATISKNCFRIQFLNEKPVVFQLYFEINNNQINRVHSFKYLEFDLPAWSKNRKDLTDWIADNHPENNDFMKVQDISYGLQYRQLIELYKKSNQKD